MIAYYADLLGVLVFAVSGALAASGKNMYKDLFGLSFTGFATAVGGGTIRDITLGAYPVAWVKDNNYLIAIFTGILIAVLLRRQFARMQKVFLLFDSIGIAIYTIVRNAEGAKPERGAAGRCADGFVYRRNGRCYPRYPDQ
jgi:uncharacterized membrane protein YeiH